LSGWVSTINPELHWVIGRSALAVPTVLDALDHHNYFICINGVYGTQY